MAKRRAKKQPRNKYKIIIWAMFFILLACSLVAEKFIKIHAVAGLDGRMFFHAWFGLSSCIIFVIFAKVLGFFIKRQEPYYK